MLGVPEIVGGVGAGTTVMAKAGSETLELPSLTLITIFEWLPATVGVPLKRPLVVEKVAQVGRLTIEKDSLSPLTSLAIGRNEYIFPTCTIGLGVPDIVGGAFPAMASVAKKDAASKGSNNFRAR